MEVYFDQMFDRATKGDATTAPYGITPADVVGTPISLEKENAGQ